MVPWHAPAARLQYIVELNFPITDSTGPGLSRRLNNSRQSGHYEVFTLFASISWTMIDFWLRMLSRPAPRPVRVFIRLLRLSVVGGLLELSTSFYDKSYTSLLHWQIFWVQPTMFLHPMPWWRLDVDILTYTNVVPSTNSNMQNVSIFSEDRRIWSLIFVIFTYTPYIYVCNENYVYKSFDKRISPRNENAG